MKIFWITLPREQSAFVYAIFESLEGAMSFSTLDVSLEEKQKGFCKLEVVVSDEEEFFFTVNTFKKQFYCSLEQRSPIPS